MLLTGRCFPSNYFSNLFLPLLQHYYILFVPVGMAGMFSAMIRLPLTAVVIVFEMTSVVGDDTRNTLVFPMLFCSMISYFINIEMQGEDNIWDLMMEQDNIDPR